MSRDTIEYKAVTYLEMHLLNSKYIIPEINTNDKTPSWDGDVFLYSDEKHAKDSLVGRVPIQVKGKCVNDFPKTLSYSIEWADLHNYYNDKGIIFFVVCIHKETSDYQIYYKELPLLELRNLFDKYSCSKSTKTKSLSLNLFPKGVIEMEHTLFTFLMDMNKQLVLHSTEKLPSLSNVNKMGAKMEVLLERTSDNPLRSLTEKSAYLYTTIDESHGVSLPYKEGKCKIVEIVGENDWHVSVNDVEYYTISKVVYKERLQIFHIGDSFQLELNDHGGKSSIHLSNNLTHRAHDLSFLISALETGSFTIKDARYDSPFTYSTKEFNISILDSFKRQFPVIRFYYDTLTKLGVTEDLQIDLLSEQDEGFLNYLGKCLSNEKVYETKGSSSVFQLVTIANLTILFVLNEIGHSNDVYQYKVHPIKNVDIYIPELNSDREEPVSIITYIRHEKPELLTQLSNLDWEHFIDEYNRLSRMNLDFQIQMATEDMLEILTQYDKTNKSCMLEYAKKVQCWIKSRIDLDNNNEVCMLNDAQIYLREHSMLDETRKSRLLYILSQTSQVDIKYAVLLLLGDMTSAKNMYECFGEEVRNILDKQPISRFKNF